MKIIIQTDRSEIKPKYKVLVNDDKDTIQEQTVHTIEERDSLVWKLVQIYNVEDIEFVEIKKAKQRIRLSEPPVVDFEDEETLIEFMKDNIYLLCNRLMEAVEEGLYYNLNTIKVLALGDTGVYLTSDRKDWVNGLMTATNYFETVEDYEGCLIANSLIKQLRNETDTTNLCY
jgi:hypothetical protein